MLEDGSRHTGKKFLLFGSKPKASAEPSGVPCPTGPDFGDQPLLSPERDPDAARNADCFLTIPDRFRRFDPGPPVVLDDAAGPLRQLFLLAAGQAVIPAVPSPTPDLDVGDHSLLTIDLQGNAGFVSPFRDQVRVPAGSDRYTLLHRFATFFRYRKNHSKLGLEHQTCRLACPFTEAAGDPSPEKRPTSRVRNLGKESEHVL